MSFSLNRKKPSARWLVKVTSRVFVLTLLASCILGYYMDIINLQLMVLLAFLEIGFLTYIFTNLNRMSTQVEFPSVKFLYIVYFIILTSLFLLLAVTRWPMMRPRLYFLMISGAFGVLSIVIYTTEFNSLRNQLPVLTLIIATTYVNFLSIVVGLHHFSGDSSMHMHRAGSIIRTGHIWAMPGYTDTPVYHLLWATISLVNGAPIDGQHYAMVILPSLAPLFFYILTKKIISHPSAPLYAALMAGFLPLLLRIKLQTEALMLPILIPMGLILIYARNDNRYVYLFFPTFMALSLTHHYYRSIFISFILILVIINFILRQTPSMPISGYLTAFIGIIGSSIFLLSNKLFYVAQLFVDFVQISPVPSTTQVSPSFLGSKPNLLEYVLIHFAEFAVVSLSVVAFLYWLERYNKRTVVFTVGCGIFGILTLILILMADLTWGVSYRNAYFIAVLIIPPAGFALGALNDSYGWKTVVVTALLITGMAMSGLGGTQSRTMDPLFYSGEVRSPELVTVEQAKVVKSFNNYNQKGVILSDSTVASNKSLASMVPGNGKEIQFNRFSKPNLTALSKQHDYLITNELILEHGMTFRKHPGRTFNRRKLRNHTLRQNKVWDSGQMNIYTHVI